ncbi:MULTISPECIES: acetate--CoA ligase family protein [unclassified Sphingobium]|uniref:acetate--CoA ligase family protein n=1 Tax=unclassified Sphingobium TaxID=2611147 RepID=UPI00119C38CE|nr:MULTISPECIES: acetate--CoA ligase family protein [unclassified Sphingobium]MBG6120070.1 acyl-CoA synthetase (NDP forming) [Sphingobium sp. JAI105]TWD05729.1 acyl-CoA synthetase (NDP forming) [Sphingobium sp. AEW010]TWD23282.1 acyl-CoA synthetase (NDP forming) [Sphingobium sp. AEW013]TWD25142.1 acyl-CoA synthetase (NDP forming) [Sphingobium sp. AEW001]
MTHPLHSLIWPQSVAVIGASEDLSKINGRLLAFLRNSGYTGRIIPINPKRAEVSGLPAFPSIDAVGEPVDIALIAIGADMVLSELERCAAAGVRNAIVITSGFAEEAGGEGAKAQARMGEIARETGMRIVGPNTVGIYNAIAPCAATFSPTVEKASEKVAEFNSGRVGIIANSGGVGFALYSHGRRLGIPFSHVIASGNEADLSIADYLDYLVEDDDTSVILLFCEAIRDAQGFRKAAAKAADKGKPIIAIKVGQSDAGGRATASHTASVAGNHAAYRALFAEYGIIEALYLSEAMMMASLLVTGGRPKGNRVGVVTVSGGAGAWAADALERAGLDLPMPSEGTRAELGKLLPSYGSAINPIDVTASGARNGGVQAALETLAASGEVDSIVLVLSAAASFVTLDQDSLAKVVAKIGVPVFVYSYTVISEAWREGMIACNLPLTNDVNSGAIALGLLAQPVPERSMTPPVAVPPGVAAAVTGARESLCEYEVKAILKAAGIDTAPEMLVNSADEAEKAAESLGYPVVMKIQSPRIQHKTEVGGLRLNLKDAAAVREAYDALAAVGERHAPGAVDGVLVQTMAPSGTEIIVGMVRDDSFGPVMMVGFGGVAIELYKDVAYGLGPVSPEKARAMLDELKSAPLLHGYRGRPALAVDALAKLVSDVSRLAVAVPEIGEMEINPVILHADGSGLTIADALLIRAEATTDHALEAAE